MSRAMRLPMWLAAAMLILAPLGGHAQPQKVSAPEIATAVTSVLSQKALSRALWPGWDLSDTPVAVVAAAGDCYLVGHDDPPPAFSRVQDTRPAVYLAPAAGVGSDSWLIGGVPTAFVSLDDLCREAVPAVIEASFRTFQMTRCPALAEPLDLLAGYPLDSRNLALVDIECEVLSRAVLAPEDSLEQRVLEFACVRSFRRLTITPRAVDYERRLEFLEGLPAYVAECSRREGRQHLKGKSAQALTDACGVPTSVAECLTPPGNLEWYRRGRFRASGAAVCALLDRFHPAWKRETAKECREPFAALWELVRRDIPRSTEILARMGYDRRLSDMQAFIDSQKSPGEKLFESITKTGGPLLTISTRLLTGATVNYDPTNIVKVDAHRAVHTRMIKIEYTDGTRVEIRDRPIAAVTGDDEFDIDQLIVVAPEQYTVRLRGEPVVLVAGTQRLDGPLSVEGPGLLIEAQSGMMIVGDERVTFVLQR